MQKEKHENMKKNRNLLTTLFVAFTLASSAYAQNCSKQVVNTIQLTYGIYDQTNKPSNHPRMPTKNIILSFQDHTLLLHGTFEGYILHIIDFEDNIVYQTELYGEDYLELPDYLTGQYLIRLLKGNQYYEGIIEL